jgi:hypothetical protein
MSGAARFAHVAIHHPKPEHADDLLASMKRLDAAGKGTEGLVQIGAWRDERSGRLVGLALWESRVAFEAAAPTLFAAVADDPFDVWSERPPETLHLHPA